MKPFVSEWIIFVQPILYLCHIGVVHCFNMVFTQHKKDRLFDLMESLSGPEKAYIKKRAKAFRTDASAHYLKLFDLLERQSVYNEKKLQVAFGSTEQLSRTKNYLYNFILNALEGYQAAGSPAIQQKEVLSTVEILFNRGLLLQSKQVLLTGLEKPSFKYNYFTYLEALSWRKKIALAELDTIGLKETTLEEIRVNRMSQNLHQFEALYYRAFCIEVLAKDKSLPAVRDEITDVLSSCLLQEETQALSIQALSLFHRIKSLCFSSIGNFQESLRSALNRVTALEEYPEYLTIDPQNYIHALSNAIEIAMFEKQYHTAENLINRLKDFRVANYHLSARKDTRAVLTGLQVAIMADNFTLADQLSTEVKNLTHKYSRLILPEEKIHLQFLLVTLFMNHSNYKTALYWVNLIMNESAIDVNVDLQTKSRLINLFIHYKLGHFDLLEYLINATYNYLKRKKSPDASEELILDFLKDEINSLPTSTFETKIKTLKQNLDQLAPVEKDFNAFSLLRF